MLNPLPPNDDRLPRNKFGSIGGSKVLLIPLTFQAQAIDQWFIDAPSDQSSQAGASGKIRLGWEPRSQRFRRV